MQNNSAENMPHRANLWKGLVVGAVSGLVGAWVMNEFQAAWQKLAEGEERGHGAQSMQHGSPSHGVGAELKERGTEREDDDATHRLAEIISEEAFDQTLTRREREAAGTAIHYAFGVSTGAMYGAAAEYVPQITGGAGLPLGAFVWVAADEVVVPLLGLSKMPAEYPVSTHAYSLASHFVYGLTAEMTRRAIRTIL